MVPAATIAQWVKNAVEQTAVHDLHTHLFPPSFKKLVLWDIDDLLTYHYLIAETLRLSDISYEAYWGMTKAQQAQHIWQTLFVENPPLSEACRGILTVLSKLGIDTSTRDLGAIRRHFPASEMQRFFDRTFQVANCSGVVMTNDPLDPVEREYWQSGTEVDPRFKTALRIDRILLDWPAVAKDVSDLGYRVSGDISGQTTAEVRRFLEDWVKRIKPLYVACSLSPTWRYPDDNVTTRILDQCVLPVAREHNLPMALMVGVTRGTNPQLRLAGDAVGKSDITSIHRICATNPRNKFMCTMLARENTHELAVAARKHRNLLVFGCWWFLNNPSLIEETTRMRIELLGPSFVPQHSDARVLLQLIYKWDHSRTVLAKVLTDKFVDLAATGWNVTQNEVTSAAKGYLAGQFQRFIDMKI